MRSSLSSDLYFCLFSYHGIHIAHRSFPLSSCTHKYNKSRYSHHSSKDKGSSGTYVFPEEPCDKRRKKGHDANQSLVDSICGAGIVFVSEVRNVGLADAFRKGHIYTIEREEYPEKNLFCRNTKEKIDYREKKKSIEENLFLSDPV